MSPPDPWRRAPTGRRNEFPFLFGSNTHPDPEPVGACARGEKKQTRQRRSPVLPPDRSAPLPVPAHFQHAAPFDDVGVIPLDARRLGQPAGKVGAGNLLRLAQDHLCRLEHAIRGKARFIKALPAPEQQLPPGLAEKIAGDRVAAQRPLRGAVPDLGLCPRQSMGDLARQPVADRSSDRVNGIVVGGDVGGQILHLRAGAPAYCAPRFTIFLRPE